MFDEQSSTDKEQERIKNVMKQIEEFVAQAKPKMLENSPKMLALLEK